MTTIKILFENGAVEYLSFDDPGEAYAAFCELQAAHGNVRTIRRVRGGYAS